MHVITLENESEVASWAPVTDPNFYSLTDIKSTQALELYFISQKPKYKKKREKPKVKKPRKMFSKVDILQSLSSISTKLSLEKLYSRWENTFDLKYF